MRTREKVVHETRMPRVRGGVSMASVFTGVLVALGAMSLLSAIVGGILVATGTTIEEIQATDAVDAGIAAGIALVAAQFLSYLWGGYTAGRMGRGAGLAHGILVPLVAILLVVAVGAVATALGAAEQINAPFTTGRLPLTDLDQVDFGAMIAISGIAAMFVGGIAGSAMGARWHTKLERRALAAREAGQESVETRTVEDAAEERRRLSERAAARRPEPAPAATAPAPPVQEPVVTRTSTPPASVDVREPAAKPSFKDRLRGRG